jgi:hypothetical protein
MTAQVSVRTAAVESAALLALRDGVAEGTCAAAVKVILDRAVDKV